MSISFKAWKYGDNHQALPHNVSPKIYADICRAIKEKRKIAITYIDYRGYNCSKIVQAKGLNNIETLWLFSGYCGVKKKFRCFDLNKITSTNLIEQNEANSSVLFPKSSNFSESHADSESRKYSSDTITNNSFSQRSYNSANGRYVGLFISNDVYMLLEKKLFSLTEEKRYQFFCIYQEKYGKNAKNYALNTFHNWKKGMTSLSGATKDRILQTVPKVLSAEERFELFEKIIDDNEIKQKIKSNHFFEYTIDEWRTERKKIETAIHNATVRYINSLDYAKKYDLTQIGWVADKDIETFKKMLESIKKQAFINKLSNLNADLNVFESKWNKIDLSNPGEKKVEIEFQYKIPTDYFRIIIYNKIYRDAKKRNELINNWASYIIPILIFITLICLIRGCSK